LASILYRRAADDAERTRLLAAQPESDWYFRGETDEIADILGLVDVVAGELTEAELSAADRLRWLHSWAAGPAVPPALIQHPCVFTSSKGNGAVALAEHALLLMLICNRNAVRWLDAQREHHWDRYTHGELFGKTVGLVGLGHSGAHLAAVCSALGMRVIGVRRNSSLPCPNVETVYPTSELAHFLSEADFVVVTAPYTTETRNMLGEAEFRSMKPTAHYICVSRGGIADDAALERALRENWIAGAGLDAHTIEPLPADSPFWSLANTVVTPHNGATTAATQERGIEIFLENLSRYVDGRTLVNQVDRKAGY
jgi:phosphoglycerate dehydrogenase-like enzyme